MKVFRSVVVAIGLGLLALAGTVPTLDVLAPLLHAQRELAQLQGMAELKSWFNGNKGRPRLILLLSPT